MQTYNLSYQPTYEMSEKNIFLDKYYTGVDVDVYINDVKCEHIESIQYYLQEQVLPIYGYNSYVYDDIAIGNRIVTGTIKIPTTNYNAFIEELVAGSSTIVTPRNAVSVNAPRWVHEANYTPRTSYKNIIPSMYYNGEVISTKSINSRASISLPDNEGGGSTTPELNTPEVNIPEFNIPETTKQPKYQKPFFDNEFNSTDIETRTTIRANHKDIKIYVGETVTKHLIDVVFGGVNTTYDASGNPIFEILNFVAKDLKEINNLK